MANEIAPPEPVLPAIRRVLCDRRGLVRLGAWGCSAAFALGLLAVTSQTERGSERIQSLIARATQSEHTVAVADVPPRVIGINPDSLRLEAQLRVLTADRDRLMARIANLEHNIDDMTGSIKRQAVAVAEPPAAKTPAPVSTQAPAPAPPPPVIAPLAMPASSYNVAAWPPSLSAQASAPEPVPLPPVRVAVAPAGEPEPPRKAEIGVDLGGAQTMEVLTARWTAVKANFGPLLTGLHPLAAHDSRPGISNFRLVVGPLPTNAAAAQLCARFAAARVTCRTAKFDGERFAQR